MRCLAILVIVILGIFLPVQSWAVDSFFDVWTEVSVAAPPYPTPGNGASIGHPDGGGTLTDGYMNIFLNQVDDGVDPLATQSAASDSGGASQWSVDSFFDVFTELAGGDWVVDSFFDITYEVHLNGGNPGILVPLHPELPFGDPGRFFDVYFVDSFFDITYQVDFGAGIHAMTAHGQVQAVQAITNVQAMPSVIPGGPGSVDSFFDITVEVGGGPPGPAIDPGLPLLHLRNRGTYTPAPVPVERVTWGEIKKLFP